MSYSRRKFLQDSWLVSMLSASPRTLMTAAATGAGIFLPSRYVLAQAKVYRDLAITSDFGPLRDPSGRQTILKAEQIRDNQPLIEQFFVYEARDHQHASNLTLEDLAMIRNGQRLSKRSEMRFGHNHTFRVDPNNPIPGGNTVYEEAPAPTTPTPLPSPPASGPVTPPGTTPPVVTPPVTPAPTPTQPLNPAGGYPTVTPPVYTPGTPGTNVGTNPNAGTLTFDIRLGQGESPFLYLMSSKPLVQGGAKFRGAQSQWHNMFQVDINNRYVFSSQTPMQLQGADANGDIFIEFSATAVDGSTHTAAFLIRRR